jgi:N-acetylglucosaminyldiphosphoundecaprenol N-acetyl-beta-D-mannosaminyltransferase
MRTERSRAAGGGPFGDGVIERSVLLGVPLARLGMDEMVAWIARAIASRRPHQIATANVNFLSLGRRDAEFLRLLQEASLVTADGMPLCWASRLQGLALPERVTGADLVPRLFELAAGRGYRVYLMGPPGATDETARRATARHAGLTIAGIETPPYGAIESWDNLAYCRRIHEARTDLLLVGLGAPKQDRWIAKYLPETRAAVAIGVGASFDYLAGRVRRAPAAVQAVGLEWAWRLGTEPRRLWRRYVGDAARVVPALVRQLTTNWLLERRARGDAAGRADVRRVRGRADAYVLVLSGRIGADRLPAVRRVMGTVPAAAELVVVDLTAASFLAPALLGDLVTFVACLRATGGKAVLVHSGATVRLLDAAGLATLAPCAEAAAEALADLPFERARPDPSATRRPVAA